MDAATGWFLTLIGIIVAQTGTVFWRLGKMEGSIKKSACPFGNCPLYERAKDEASKPREIDKSGG